MALKNQWEKRVEVFHYIYQILMTQKPSKDIVKNAFEDYSFDADQMKIIEYYSINVNDIKGLIVQHLAEKWTWDRIPYVTRAIIITAYCESKVSKLDRKIIIDQALVTAGKYCEAKDKKFVNAILDKIIK